MTVSLVARGAAMGARPAHQQPAAPSSLLPRGPRPFLASRPAVAARSGAVKRNALTDSAQLSRPQQLPLPPPTPPCRAAATSPAQAPIHPPLPLLQAAQEGAANGTCGCARMQQQQQRQQAAQETGSSRAGGRHAQLSAPPLLLTPRHLGFISTNPFHMFQLSILQQAILQPAGAAGRPRGGGGGGGRRLLGQHSASCSAGGGGCQALLCQQRARQVGLLCSF